MIERMIRALVREEVRSPERLPPGVSLRSGRLVPVLGGFFSGMRRPAAAVTLGRTIIVHPGVELTGRLIRHELAHVRQWQRNPLLFPARYVWNHIRYGYDGNPFEMEARDAEGGTAA